MRRTLLPLVASGLLTLAGCGGVAQQDAAPATSPSAEPAAVVPSVVEPAAVEAQLPPRRLTDLPQAVAFTGEDWPQYRGAKRDGISQAQGLARSWPAEGPAVVWETAVGQGYSAPTVVAGNVDIEDYNEEQGEWMVRCLSLNTGEELWTYKVKKRIRPNHGITRSAPATDGGFVVAIDPKCEVHCLDARNGDVLWKKFLPEVYGSQIPPWYNGQCPLIDGDRVVLGTGGKAVLTALDKATGETIWETPNSEEFLMSHSSVMPVEIAGVKQYAYTTLKGAVGVEAETGKLLWYFPWKFNTAVCTTPLPVGDDKLLLTSGYHAQTVVCQIKREGDQWQAEEVVSLPPPTSGWNSEVHTPIVHRNYIYGVGKKQRGLWTCLDLEGNEVWTSAKKASFELGGYLLAEDMFFVLEGTTGTMRVLDANADEYSELASFQVLEGPDVWAPPVISHGKLLIRDMGKLVCLDISAKGTSVAATEQISK